MWHSAISVNVRFKLKILWRPAYRRGVYSQDLISGGRGVERVEGESVGRYMTSPENLIFFDENAIF